MPRNNNGITEIVDLINPEVLGEYLDVKMMEAIKFAPLCGVNRDLEGRPGSILTLPMYQFIGLAEDVAEGADVTFGELGSETVKVEVKKAGRGVRITDEAILNAYGNPVDEVAKQLLMAISGKVDDDCVAAFRGAKMVKQDDGSYEEVAFTAEDEDAKITAARKAIEIKTEDGNFNKEAIVDMIAAFGDDIEEPMTLIINPAHLAILRKDNDFVAIENGQKVISGEIGQLYGVRIVVSNKVQEKEAFLVKAGAVEILMKRNVMVEADRNITNKTNEFVVDEHYAVYLKYPEKLVKATFAKQA